MCDNYKEEDIKQKDIYIMNYPSDKELSFSFGIIRDIQHLLIQLQLEKAHLEVLYF